MIDIDFDQSDKGSGTNSQMAVCFIDNNSITLSAVLQDL